MESPNQDASSEPAELLRLRTENAQLRATLQAGTTPASPTPPWWKSGATITTLTAIVAAIVPVTTALQGWAQKNRELALEDRKQTENIRTSYLERLQKALPGEHLRTLRFVVATTNDNTLRAWAVKAGGESCAYVEGTKGDEGR